MNKINDLEDLNIGDYFLFKMEDIEYIGEIRNNSYYTCTSMDLGRKRRYDQFWHGCLITDSESKGEKGYLTLAQDEYYLSSDDEEEHWGKSLNLKKGDTYFVLSDSKSTDIDRILMGEPFADLYKLTKEEYEDKLMSYKI